MSGQSEQPESTMDPTTWVDEHGDLLYRFALSRLRDPEAAEEVVQETFVAALKAKDQYRGSGSEGAWLLGILKRKVIDLVRRRGRPDAGRGTEPGEDPTEALFDEKGNWKWDPRITGRRPEALIERDEFWEVFHGCLGGLPQRQADVFSLRELEELSSESICKELEITSSNLWVLLHRARLRLMKCMKTHLARWGER